MDGDESLKEKEAIFSINQIKYVQWNQRHSKIQEKKWIWKLIKLRRSKNQGPGDGFIFHFMSPNLCIRRLWNKSTLSNKDQRLISEFSSSFLPFRRSLNVYMDFFRCTPSQSFRFSPLLIIWRAISSNKGLLHSRFASNSLTLSFLIIWRAIE